MRLPCFYCVRGSFPPTSSSHSAAASSSSFVLSGRITRLRFLDSFLLRFHNFWSCASSSAVSDARIKVSSRTTSSGIAALSTMASGGEVAVFNLSDSSLVKIRKGDITKWSVDGSTDAIVNPANERMLGGGGADGAIHRAAGPQLRAACYEVPEVRPGVRCPTGEARITPGFNLPASRVIHTVGPIYNSDSNPQQSLANAYKNSLRVAKENNIQFIAFPAISCGIYGYPLDKAASVAISTVKHFANDLKEVHFVMIEDDTYSEWINKANELLQS